MGYNTAWVMIEGVSAAGTMDLLDATFDAADLFASPNAALCFEEAASAFLHPAWGPDEDFIFGLMEQRTGISGEDLAAASYQRLEFLGA